MDGYRKFMLITKHGHCSFCVLGSLDIRYFFAFSGGRRNESDKLIDTQNIQPSLEFI